MSGVGARERGVERELIRQREREVVVLDRGDVDGLTAVRGVPVVQRIHVAEAEHRVAHAETCEVHHRVADVAQLQVEHGGDLAALVVELARIPDDHRLAARVRERIACKPPEAELEKRVGPLLGVPEPALVHVHADLTRLRRRRRTRDPVPSEDLDVERMDAREDPHVVVHDRLALGVGRALEVVLTGNAVRHERAWLVDPTVNVGNGDPALFEELPGSASRARAGTAAQWRFGLRAP